VLGGKRGGKKFPRPKGKKSRKKRKKEKGGYPYIKKKKTPEWKK